MANERRVEFLIGAAFILFLIIVIVLVLNLIDGGSDSNNKKVTKESTSSSEPIVINNYYNYENKDNSLKKSYTGDVVYKHPDYNYVVYKDDCDYWRDCDYDCEDPCDDYDWNDNEFSSYGEQRKIRDSLHYIDEYSVFVRNEDNVRKYFKVIFYFEDESGFDDTHEIIRLIRPGEKIEFRYRDSNFQRNGYERWSYDVFSQDDDFDEVLYDSNFRKTDIHTNSDCGCSKK